MCHVHRSKRRVRKLGIYRFLLDKSCMEDVVQRRMGVSVPNTGDLTSQSNDEYDDWAIGGAKLSEYHVDYRPLPSSR